MLGLLDMHYQGMYCQYMTVLNWGRRIKQLRESQGLTQPALAAKARVSVSYLAKLEAGERQSPSAPALGRLARALGAAPDILLSFRWKQPGPANKVTGRLRRESAVCRISDSVKQVLADSNSDHAAIGAAGLLLQQHLGEIQALLRDVEMNYLHAAQRRD
jgi:transcriptional regulator with XRE-family HTH domain